MPEVIEALPTRGGRPARYPWTEWADGQVWKFTRLELADEYGTSPDSFASTARGHAVRHGFDLRVRKIDGGAAVAIQFVKADG